MLLFFVSVIYRRSICISFHFSTLRYTTMALVLKPSFTTNPAATESPEVDAVISALKMMPHIEGGYFIETDRSPDIVSSPFPIKASSTSELTPKRPGFDPTLRNTSTTIHYFLTPNGPQGGFHRNKGRTVHTLHKGRGRYVIIHANESGKEKRIESFIVGPNIEKGEKLQWIVEGDKYKASYLLPDEDGGVHSQGLLISETVVPGFEFCDHDFLSRQSLEELIGVQKAQELGWLLSPLAK
jgi:predicted cupin superfamily sugar epimerase